MLYVRVVGGVKSKEKASKHDGWIPGSCDLHLREQQSCGGCDPCVFPRAAFHADSSSEMQRAPASDSCLLT